MPNLVGIGLSQVPTNSMLGGLAYQDPEHASIKDLDLKNLSQINSEIADTAVDVFVYDTRKDSDGGAWRKRTQNTSWYNETLGTGIRGTRKEFPAVAVIVATSSKVTIYDGDDPDLPMWMVFNKVSTSPYGFLSYTPSAIYMLNGILMFVGYTASKIYFIQDFASIYFDTGYYQWLYPEIVNRNASSNAGGSTPLISSSISIISTSTNDVAMTVLPNAPVDSATGLPVPTIAVATAGGTSVIKDDGRVVDIVGSTASTYKGINKIHFTPDNKLAFSAQQSGSHTGYYRYLIANIPNSDLSENYWQNFSVDELIDYAYSNYSSSIPALFANNGVSGTINAVSKSNSDKDNAIGGGQSLTLLSRSESQSTDMGCYITSDYNTGWMHGDIKGAFLSDTDATNVTGSNLIDNGDFSSALDTNVWINYNSTSNVATYSIVSGELKVIENNTNDYGIVSQHLTGLTVGKQYGISVDSRATTATARWFIGNSQGSAGIVSVQDTTSSTFVRKSAVWTAVSTDAYVNLAAVGAAGATAYFDNITVKEVEPDRSVNNNGLQVFGTITKSAVATGAELVGYSSSSNTSYLEQPYNSALDYGTGDMYYSMWVYANSSDSFSGSTYLFERSSVSDTNNRRIEARMTTSTRLEIYSNGLTLDNNVYVPANAWYKLDILRRSGEAIVYINGEYRSSTTGAAATNSLTDTSAKLVIGNRAYFATRQYGFPSNSKIALFRTGASAPSAEQIKKIYEDEKILFQENAKATLYGSSDAVTALAFDDTTELLHVGTSAGRSEFQGLRRINNTTDAVTTAISASNGFVAEQ